MKPSKLKRHLECKHPEYVSKPIDFFHKKSMKSTLSMGSSYEVSKLIAETGYSHTVGEKLILPALNSITSRIYGGKKGNQLGSLSLSNNTVKRRIEEIAKNIEEMLIHRLQNSQFFALQVDEITDIADAANLMCFVRYDYESSIQDDLLFCKPLPTRTTAADIFKLINDFIIQSDIDWKKCVGLSSDGARAMAGSCTGLVLQIRAVVPDCVWVHCSNHREALAVKTMPSLLSSTLQECVKFINYIKARPLNSRIFTALCNELGSEHEHLLLHCESRWLSKGNILKRLFEMKDEVLLFLEPTPSIGKFKDRFHEFDWFTMVAYLCDIFCLLSELSLNLQGTKINIFKVDEKEKLCLWAQRVNKRNFKSFCTSTELQEKCDFCSNPRTSILNEYFPPIDASKMWIKNPFTVDTENEEILQLSASEVDSLIELSCDSALKENFDKLSLIDFWLSCRNEYSHSSEKAVKFLMPFVTTYKCETSFSSLVFFKNKYRNRLNVEPDLRIKLS
uniref:Uncharacterized protein n=1 Tax=Pelodiscus sinensis TaxID=13735 RepID=K7F206_PELSI